MLAYFTMTLLMLVGFFLILLILLQRGRGGGLAGAFGGLGGASAFGTKAGDVFTKITVVVAVLWVGLAGINIWILDAASASPFEGAEEAPEMTTQEQETEPGQGANETPAGTPETTLPDETESAPAENPEPESSTDATAPEDSTAAPSDAGDAPAGEATPPSGDN